MASSYIFFIKHLFFIIQYYTIFQIPSHFINNLLAYLQAVSHHSFVFLLNIWLVQKLLKILSLKQVKREMEKDVTNKTITSCGVFILPGLLSTHIYTMSFTMVILPFLSFIISHEYKYNRAQIMQQFYYLCILVCKNSDTLYELSKYSLQE